MCALGLCTHHDACPCTMGNREANTQMLSVAEAIADLEGSLTHCRASIERNDKAGDVVTAGAMRVRERELLDHIADLRKTQVGYGAWLIAAHVCALRHSDLCAFPLCSPSCWLLDLCFGGVCSTEHRVHVVLVCRPRLPQT